MKYCRKCSNCNSGMNEGYINDNEYYCSIACLNENMTDEEYCDLHNEPNSNTYWTEWNVESDAEYELINNTLTEIE